jgi:hypothetical protein
VWGDLLKGVHIDAASKNGTVHFKNFDANATVGAFHLFFKEKKNSMFNEIKVRIWKKAS